MYTRKELDVYYKALGIETHEEEQRQAMNKIFGNAEEDPKDKLIRELERLHAAATQGPWEVDDLNNIRIAPKGRPIIATIHDYEDYLPRMADAQYIVASCNAVPELIQRIKELEKEKQDNALHWTKEPPRKSGWYFFRVNIPGYRRASVIYVDIKEDLLLFECMAPWRIREIVKKYNVEFAGPMPEPVEDKEQ